MRLKIGYVLSLLLILQQTIVAQETNIRGFADVGLTATDGAGGRFAFSLGQYDIYITSELSDRITFIGETVFEYDENWLVDVERVLIKYVVNDYLQLSLANITPR